MSFKIKIKIMLLLKIDYKAAKDILQKDVKYYT